MAMAWGGGGHVHLSHRFGIVESCGLSSRFLVFITMKNRVNVLACSVWARKCTALLWRDIFRPFYMLVLTGCHIDPPQPC